MSEFLLCAILIVYIQQKIAVCVFCWAGEALGAFTDPRLMPLLQKYLSDPVPEVAETCQLALSLLTWSESNNTVSRKSPYFTIDPAPPAEITDVRVLREILLDENKSLFDRYRAMFSLRNLATAESVLALTEGN